MISRNPWHLFLFVTQTVQKAVVWRCPNPPHAPRLSAVPSRIPKPGAAVSRAPSADPAAAPAAAAAAPEAAEAVSTHVIRRLADLQALLRRAAEQRTVAQPRGGAAARCLAWGLGGGFRGACNPNRDCCSK